MGNGTSRAVGCFVPSGVAKDGVDLDLLEPLDEGLGHSFCYVRPVIADSPAITPSNSDRYTVVSNALDSDTRSASFRQEIAEESQRASKNSSETTFRTISGASVSANTSTARTGNPNVLISNDTQEPAASFESTASFASVPLQPLPRGSGPLNAFMSGPLGRGFASGPLERGAGLMSGPLDKGFFMSGPLDSADTSSFSAPLGHGRGKTRFGQLVRSMSRPMTSVLSKTFTRRQRGSGWIYRFLLHPMSHLVWHSKDTKPQSDPSRNCLEAGSSEPEYCSSRNLQWAHGKAGEDRVHVVLSEEQGWLFVGIYDGFSGPDAPDFLMNNLYKAVDKELEGLLWYYEDKSGHIVSSSDLTENDASKISSSVVKQESLSSELQQGELWNSGSVNLSFGNQCEEGVALDPSHEENFRLESSMGDNLGKGSSVGGPTSEGETEDNKLWCEIPRDCKSYRDDGNLDAGGHADVSHKKTSCISGIKLESRCRKSKRLYELLQIELLEDHGKDSYLSSGNATARRSDSWDLQLSASGDFGISSREISSPVHPVLHSSSTKRKNSRLGEELVGIQESNAVVSSSSKESKQKYVVSFSAAGQKQMMRVSLFGTRLRKMYRKHKFSHRKLFSWSYYGNRNPSNLDDRVDNSSMIIRRCKSGPVDHDAVLKAMTRALEATEEAFVDMVEKALDRNPELTLMGSCVLVMLMKDQDVYVMNLGDSRVILAQDRLNDVYNAQTVTTEDARHQNSMRDTLVHMELDRISEESPMHNPKSQLYNTNKTRELSLCSLKMRAVQLSSDHSTSIEEV